MFKKVTENGMTIPKRLFVVDRVDRYGRKGIVNVEVFPEALINSHTAPITPGPNSANEYRVGHIYDIKWSKHPVTRKKTVAMFAVSWFGFESRYDTLEPPKHVSGCAAIGVFASSKINCFSGSVCREMAEKLVESVLRPTRSEPRVPEFEEFACLSTREDIELGANEFEKVANEMLRECMDRNEFCVYFGYFGPKSEPRLAFEREAIFCHQLAQKWANVANERFVLYEHVIGSTDRTVKARSASGGIYVSSAHNITKDFRRHLNCGKGVAALVVRPQGLFSEDKDDFHCRVLFVLGPSNGRQIRMFDPKNKVVSVPTLVSKIRDLLTKAAVILMASGSGESGRTCIRKSFRFTSTLKIRWLNLNF